MRGDKKWCAYNNTASNANESSFQASYYRFEMPKFEMPCDGNILGMGYKTDLPCYWGKSLYMKLYAGEDTVLDTYYKCSVGNHGAVEWRNVSFDTPYFVKNGTYLSGHHASLETYATYQSEVTSKSGSFPTAVYFVNYTCPALLYTPSTYEVNSTNNDHRGTRVTATSHLGVVTAPCTGWVSSVGALTSLACPQVTANITVSDNTLAQTSVAFDCTTHAGQWGTDAVTWRETSVEALPAVTKGNKVWVTHYSSNETTYFAGTTGDNNDEAVVQVGFVCEY